MAVYAKILLKNLNSMPSVHIHIFMKYVYRILFFSMYFAYPIFALPPFISLQDRLRDSDIVIDCNITNNDVRNYVPGIAIVSSHIKVNEIIKGSIEKEFSLTFFIFPNDLEQRLREAPRPERYYIFLKRKQTSDANGNKGTALVLYDPEPFAFSLVTEETKKELHP